ncbi:MAG: hypothetical protein Q8Q09_09575 [Deltaproteobacteria bacterium]|nr:hypothetical protein [Deltaproteobacteria bacterium]
MGSRWSQRLRLAASLSTVFAGAGMSGGCMEARPAINRVQPDFLDKMQLIPVQYGLLTAGGTPAQLTRELLRREPQWAHQVTIVDKPATTGFQGISWYTQVEKVNWEVSEGFLIARLSYDRLNRADGVAASRDPWANNNDNGINGNPRQGEILAVYGIQSHFDIRRSYNPQTGEELNVIEENGADRPWYQRRYMRIDWSRNLVGGYSAMSYAEWTGRVRAEPVPTYVNDPTDPNAPVFNYVDRPAAAGQPAGRDLTYFDVTNRMVLHPEEVNLGHWGYPNIPACILGNGIESCNPADVQLRISFMRIDPDRDYEPQALDGHRMDRFGFFEAGRVGYNRDRQDLLTTERRHFSHRHNLWIQHHMPRIEGGTTLQSGNTGVACQNNDQCLGISRTSTCVGANAGTAGVCQDRFALCNPSRADGSGTCGAENEAMGARCDTSIEYLRGDGNGVCLLPFRARQVRPIPYHLSINYPERMMPVTEEVVRQWNSAFRQAVQEARYRECLLDPAGGGEAACAVYRSSDDTAVLPRLNVPGAPQELRNDGVHVYIGCHNPVWGPAAGPGQHTQAEVDAARAAGWDTAACGPQGTVARLGDLRYSMMASINEYDRQGSWGLANVTGDPETGEIYSARGAVWQTITDLQTNNTIDILRVLAGEITPDAIANGESLRETYPGLGQNAGREARGGAGDVPSTALRMRSMIRQPASMGEVQQIVEASQVGRLDHDHAHEGIATGAEQGINPGAGVVDITSIARDPRTGRTSEHVLRERGMEMWQRTGTSPLLVSGQNDLATRLGRIRGTEVEDRMMNGAQLALGGQDPRLSGILPDAREGASPARRQNNRMRQIQREIEVNGQAHQCNYEGDLAARFDDAEMVFFIDNFRNNRVPFGIDFGRTWDFATGATAPSTVNWNAAREWLVQYVHYPVMLHELGHALGERHNFASSSDAINYNDRYWAIRSARHNNNSNMIRPRWEYTAAGQPYMSDDERNLGEDATAYSSIMDYKSTEGTGLGHYDYAFVKHGYVNMVEAFRTVANRDRALNLFQTYSGGGQQPLSFGLQGTTSANLRLTSFHYTEIPSVVGTSNRTIEIGPGQSRTGTYPNLTNENRFNVFLHETRSEGYNSLGWDPDHTNVSRRGPSGAEEEHLVVPYRFETDDYAGVYWFNSRYDGGADFYETMQYFAQRYIDYYPFSSFSRERASFTVNGYVNRMNGRYLDNMYYIMRVASIYEGFYRDIFAAVTNYNEWKQQTASVSMALGISTVFDALTTALLMPEWSRFGATFALNTRAEDGQRYFDEAGFGQNGVFQMPIGEGRQFQTTYDYASGRFWRERLVNAGSYYDKIFALNYMTDTFLFSVNRELNQDLRQYQVNVYTVYPGQTMRLFGSILSEDWSDIGPQAQIRGRDVTMVRTQLARLNLPQGTMPTQNGRDPALNAVNPNLGFTGMLWSAVLGMAGLSGSYDQRFVHSARLWSDGDPHGVGVPVTQTVTFTDPVTRLTYRALRQDNPVPGATNLDPGISTRESARPLSLDGSNYPNERGIAARMILRANDLLRFANAQPANSTARSTAFVKLQQYVDLLNVMRLLNSWYSTGGQVGGGRVSASDADRNAAPAGR